MRIGSTTLPLAGWLVDPRQPEASQQHRLGAIRQLIQDYRLSAVELTLDLAMVYPQIFDAAFYQAAAHLQQQLGFTCTVHLPFLWVDPASLNETIRQGSVECLRRAMELTHPIEVTSYVLHLWGLATVQIVTLLEHPAQRQGVLAGMVAQAGRSLGELCAAIEPRDLCVENLEAPPFDVALPLIEQHGVSICLDVGHLTWEGDNGLDFLNRHGKRIREVHLHDAQTITRDHPPQIRDHLALGQGEIDYLRLLSRLAETGFEGAVILENNTRTELEQSLARISPFL
jgi:sugar phosphate isomerase/epimerase